MKTAITWDYTHHADSYEQRADYASNTVSELQTLTALIRDSRVADIGAGTGKLTRLLSENFSHIDAVEPNIAMRRHGIKNTHHSHVQWIEGTAESTTLTPNQYDLVTFGSSFNVVNHTLALTESLRLLKSNGFLSLIWNHRDLDDPLQNNIENIIQNHIPNYDYGTRREDPTPLVLSSEQFRLLKHNKIPTTHQCHATTFLSAWHAHATLKRQAGATFDSILSGISKLIGTNTILKIPYHTQMWTYQRTPKPSIL